MIIHTCDEKKRLNFVRQCNYSVHIHTHVVLCRIQSWSTINIYFVGDWYGFWVCRASEGKNRKDDPGDVIKYIEEIYLRDDLSCNKIRYIYIYIYIYISIELNCWN